MIRYVPVAAMRSVTAHHGATRKDEAPYSSVGPTNALPSAAVPMVSQHSTVQRRLSGFPVGNSCKINGRQQYTPQDQENRKIVTSSRRANCGQPWTAP